MNERGKGKCVEARWFAWPTGYFHQAWLVLLLATLLGGMLAVVEDSLAGKIAENAERRLRQALLEVVPGGAESRAETRGDLILYRVTSESGALVGWAVPLETRGFSDKIRLLVGLSPDGRKVQGLAVLDSKETPGLGERIREDSFRVQFVGQPAGEVLETIRPGQVAEHPIHAVTGATISSRAVTNALNEQLSRVIQAITGESEVHAGGGSRDR